MADSTEYLSFIKEVGSADIYSVKLITAVNETGDFYHAYLLMKDEHTPYLEAALKTRPLELEEYGVVLARGDGIEPSAETQAAVEAQFHQHIR